MFALHQSVKVFSQVFLKNLRGFGASSPIIRRFFLPSFFFAPLVPKKKRDCGILCFLGGEENFLKKAFLPRPPSFKNFEAGVLGFIVISALNARTTYIRTCTTRGSLREGAPDEVGWRRVRNCGFCTFFEETA